MSLVNFYLSPECKVVWPELTYLFKIWAKHQGHEIAFTQSPNHSVSVGFGDENRLRISKALESVSKISFGDHPYVAHESGQRDSVSTAFYMINSLQEHHDADPDELHRFKFKNSYQHRFNNVKDNLVQSCFDEISTCVGLAPKRERSSFFLSHDIDSVNGAILEDGFNVIKKGRVDVFLQLLFNVAMARPDWLNMDTIMKLESEYDCKSIFFWIVNKGKINAREKNADYSFHSSQIQKKFKGVETNGFYNGIHKSISTETFRQEFVKYGRTPLANRYHYLKFSLPQAYHHLEDSGLRLDASLGFAEEIGFRNSYGLPFNPYNFVSRQPFKFVEVPLHIMDRTYFQYKKFSVAEAERDMVEFFERNKENSVISILWHNNFFTNHKFNGYLPLYKKILAYIKENNLRTLSPEEIIKKYSIT